MTEDEIITALECCKNSLCASCPMNDKSNEDCFGDLSSWTLNLIKSRQAEIESLKERLDIADKETQLAHKANMTYVIEAEKSKAEAIKAFADKFDDLLWNMKIEYNKSSHFDYGLVCEVVHSKLMKLVKEMTDVQK